MGVLSEALYQRATIEEVAEKPAKVGLPASIVIYYTFTIYYQ